MKRLLPHPYLSALLLLFWPLISDGGGLGTFLVALVLALAIPQVTARYWRERTPRLRPFLLLSYLAIVLWDVILANVHVAMIILFKPADRIRSAWVTVPIDLPSPEARALLAGTITMTPGTVTADFSADGRALLIHALHAPDPDAVRRDIKRRYEARLKRIFP